MLPIVGQASGLDSQLAAAQRLLSAENYQALGEVLAPLLAMPEPPLEALFLSGMAAMQTGNYSAAAGHFRAMLTRDPSLIRPRLELALALQKSGEREAARYHYEQVLSAPLPDAVKWNIYRQLSDIRARTPSLRLSLELASDTNPQQITSSKVVMIGGLPYTLSDSTQGELKWGVAAAAELLYPLPADPAWFAQVYGLAYEYPGRELDNLYGQASIGKRFEWRHNEIALSAGSHVSSYQDRRQYAGWLVRATGQWVMSSNLAWLGEASVKSYDYSRLKFLNGKLSALNATAVFISNPVRRWEFGVGVAHYLAVEDAYSYWQPSVSARVSHEWPGGWITGMRVQAQQTACEAPDPFFGLERKDIEGRVELEILNRKIRWRGFSPQLMVGYVKRDSNLEIYRYDRIYSRIGLSTSF